jgi:TonB family protein
MYVLKIAMLFGVLCVTMYGSSQNVTSTNVDSMMFKMPEIFDRAEVQPAYPGGVGELMKFLQENIKYPPEAVKNMAVGKVIVKFYIDVDGAVREPVILKDGVGFGCADEAIRVVKAMPNWTPGSQRGKLVKVYYTLPITFKLNGDLLIPAKFIGGESALNTYKNEKAASIRKPKKDKTVPYTVTVTFTVLETGKIDHAFISSATSNDPEILDQIKQAVLGMPMWSPEVFNGKPRLSIQEITFIF